MAIFNPAYIKELGVEYPETGYLVLTVAYNGTIRTWHHDTLKAAFRKLASAIGGKLRKRDEFQAIILLPDQTAVNYREAQRTIALRDAQSEI